MTSSNLLYLILLSPLFFLIVAMLSRYQVGLRPRLVIKAANLATIFGIIVAVFGSVLMLNYGSLQTTDADTFLQVANIRIDAVSLIMFGMIALLSFVIIRYSKNYLDGDKRQGVFLGRLSATIASVQLLVLAGNLAMLFVAWVFTSICLSSLLTFYADRPVALIAAKKKFIMARLADASLLLSCILLFIEFDTINLEAIFVGIGELTPASLTNGNLGLVATFLVMAAMLKSAQFPTHAWLIEVMETPTPVSAMLHAGLLNAGPFLIIRMAYVMEATHAASSLLILVGGFTAIFGSVVFMTQSSVKTALSYSSIAHMGFSLMVCGMGAYGAAMLHLVAHSFYKSHAFLSSGSVIDALKSSKGFKLNPKKNILSVILSIVLASGIYAGFAYIKDLDLVNEIPLLAIGLVILLGMTRIFSLAFNGSNLISFTAKAALFGLLVVTSFFVLESAMAVLLTDAVPELVALATSQYVMIGGLTTAFAIIVFIQVCDPFISSRPAFKVLSIHLKNGLYINALFDRMIGAFYVRPESIDYDEAINSKITYPELTKATQEEATLNH